MKHIVADTVSGAWLEAVRAALGARHGELQGLVVEIAPNEDGLILEAGHIRDATDRTLSARRVSSVETVAGTIFPASLWNPNRPRQELYDRYLRIWPRVRRYPANRRGTYFQRLIAFQPRSVVEPKNQLEFMIEAYQRGIHRRSMLQATIFDPTQDHVAARQCGFPCLQHVAFPQEEGRLGVHATYVVQDLVRKGYGNYLGLARLGQFMATELGLRLGAVRVHVSIARLGDTKAACTELERLSLDETGGTEDEVE